MIDPLLPARPYKALDNLGQTGLYMLHTKLRLKSANGKDGYGGIVTDGTNAETWR
jgi:hypothetical protein